MSSPSPAPEGASSVVVRAHAGTPELEREILNDRLTLLVILGTYHTRCAPEYSKSSPAHCLGLLRRLLDELRCLPEMKESFAPQSPDNSNDTPSGLSSWITSITEESDCNSVLPFTKAKSRNSLRSWLDIVQGGIAGPFYPPIFPNISNQLLYQYQNISYKRSEGVQEVYRQLRAYYPDSIGGPRSLRPFFGHNIINTLAPILKGKRLFNFSSESGKPKVLDLGIAEEAIMRGSRVRSVYCTLLVRKLRANANPGPGKSRRQNREWPH